MKYIVRNRQKQVNCKKDDRRRNFCRGSNCAKPWMLKTEQKTKTAAANIVSQYAANDRTVFHTPPLPMTTGSVKVTAGSPANLSRTCSPSRPAESARFGPVLKS